MKRIYVKQRADHPNNTMISARTEITAVEVYIPGRTPSDACDETPGNAYEGLSDGIRIHPQIK